jgi:succinate-semialdehyde dehydrogenase/glutarate-semialdehyde dehydrogenase
VVLDADGAGMDRLVKRAVVARLGNAGQACNAAKRFVVLDDVYDEFVEKFTAALAAIVPGDPTDPATFLGPLSSRAAADTLQGQLDTAVAAGATVLLAGGKTAEDSAYFRPAVLAGVTPDMELYYEELFGPVAMVFRAGSEAEAIAIANDTPFGLGASVHSGDADRAARVADQITAGMVSINEAAGSAAELPFGGVKRSGVGRELGRYGMEEFVNHKLVRTR